MHESGLNLEPFTPRRQAQSLAANRDEMIAAGVAGLFGIRGPFNISRLVIPIVVFAVYAVLPRRALTHVGDEGFGRFSPLFTNLNPASTVVGESAVERIVASADHSLPDFEHRKPGKAVRFFCGGHIRMGLASAVMAMAMRSARADQIRADYFDESATLTATLPQQCTMWIPTDEFKGSEKPEGLVGQIMTVETELARIGVRHGSLPKAGCG